MQDVRIDVVDVTEKGISFGDYARVHGFAT